MVATERWTIVNTVPVPVFVHRFPSTTPRHPGVVATERWTTINTVPVPVSVPSRFPSRFPSAGRVGRAMRLPSAHDVTCIVELEGTGRAKVIEEMCKSLGFEIGLFPSIRSCGRLPAKRLQRAPSACR